MQILLTPDQQSTLWYFSEKIKTDDGDNYFSFPWFLKDCGNGLFERCTFDALPENAKDMILKQRGVKI